jgi:hypothetical protein
MFNMAYSRMRSAHSQALLAGTLSSQLFIARKRRPAQCDPQARTPYRRLEAARDTLI